MTTFTIDSTKTHCRCEDIGMTREQWSLILEDDSITTPSRLKALMAFYYSPGHSCSCTEAHVRFGESVNFYNVNITQFGKAVLAEYTSCEFRDSKGDVVYWPAAMCFGDRLKNGQYSWTLRPALVEALRKYILYDASARFIADFSANQKREGYKWKALHTFESRWDIDATDFPAMLEASLADTGNLLESVRVFPRLMIIEMAKQNPEKVRGMFRNLYNEDLPLLRRIEDFISAAGSHDFGKDLQHYQNSNAVTVYLWLRYPDKYYVYKWSEYKTVAEKLGIDDIPKRGKLLYLPDWFKIFHMLRNFLADSPAILDAYKAMLEASDDYPAQPTMGTVTYDFGFWISRNYPTIVPLQQPKRWLYAPGERAMMWDDCIGNSIISIGWEEMGDLSAYDSRDSADKAFKTTYADNATGANSKLCLWEFAKVMKEGDVVYAKQGLYKILGRGIVKSEYIYDPERQKHKSIRSVEWTNIGQWDVKELGANQLPQKTLTDVSTNMALLEILESLFSTDTEPVLQPEPTVQPEPTEPRYWWLVASPKYWSFADLPVGKAVEYTVKNDKGNKRRVPVNFEQAREGDFVIGYEANPEKKIVALAQVSRASDGETISFVKTEELSEPIEWQAFKDSEELAGMEFRRNPNGSFFRLTKDEYDYLLTLIREANPEPEDSPIVRSDSVLSYTKSDFLREVFMTDESFDKLVGLLRIKKNVILQGAPGVGKTFSARRLAYAMMGCTDNSRIEIVQFHQNYSYEDFVMGYKPTDDGGFELRNGVFYDFCRRAAEHPDKDYFFIIDEINRGNLSKIFGELLMLIEKDYRGHAIRPAYRNEMFAVPANLYIIGMMNTADRSLAIIDYALRRRFSFYPMRPGLDTDGFKAEISRHADARIAAVVDAVRALNGRIAADDSLGEGFCIGHSYFCGHRDDSGWIESVVRYDLCPMLEEYWFDNKEKRDNEIQRLIELIE